MTCVGRSVKGADLRPDTCLLVAKTLPSDAHADSTAQASARTQSASSALERLVPIRLRDIIGDGGIAEFAQDSAGPLRIPPTGSGSPPAEAGPGIHAMTDSRNLQPLFR